MKQYTLQIGLEFSIETGKYEPKKTVQITKEQLTALEMFATTRKDQNLNTIYTLNSIDFRVQKIEWEVLNTPSDVVNELKESLKGNEQLIRDAVDLPREDK